MKSISLVILALALSGLATVAAMSQQRANVPITNQEWEQPFPGFKIVGNTYYVGTYDLGCYLIDTGAGLILVNSGAPGSYPLIKANIEALGFKTSDIKVITATHGHFDHVGDLAAFRLWSRVAISITAGRRGAVSSTTRSRWMSAPGPAII
jgi:metallo-beta-lactamase class B